VTAAQVAASTMLADPNFCATVSQVGSYVNTAIHMFKVAWNDIPGATPVPVGTGDYEPATANALGKVLGSSPPPACGAAQPAQIEKKSLSTGAIVGIGLGAAALVGGVTFAVTRKSARRRRRR